MNAAMFGIDAAELLPSVAMTTTTRDAVTPAELREGQAQMVRRIRREVALRARYCAIIEWTQRTTRWSGGLRRPHFHSLWKGLRSEDTEAVRKIAAEVWLRIAGADSHTCEEIRTPGGAVAYVARHHFKVSQSPPHGWSGKRFGHAKAGGNWVLQKRALAQRPLFVAARFEDRRGQTVQLVHVEEVEEIDPSTGLPKASNVVHLRCALHSDHDYPPRPKPSWPGTSWPGIL